MHQNASLRSFSMAAAVAFESNSIFTFKTDFYKIPIDTTITKDVIITPDALSMLPADVGVVVTVPPPLEVVVVAGGASQ